MKFNFRVETLAPYGPKVTLAELEEMQQVAQEVFGDTPPDVALKKEAVKRLRERFGAYSFEFNKPK